MALKKRTMPLAEKMKFPVGSGSGHFSFFLSGQCLFFIGGQQYPHVVSRQRSCETELLLRDGQGKINTFYIVN